MTMTLDDVAAKLNELDLRVPLEVFEAIASAIRDRADLWSKWQTERCFLAKAESELAALKARIAEAPIVEIANIGDPFIVLPDHLTVPNSLKGKRVRLVVEK